MQPHAEAKWEGKVSASLDQASADQIWPLFENFFDLYKWFPNLTASYGVYGVNGEVGCIRYCVNTLANPVTFTNERLTTIDSNEKTLTFEMLENSFGYNNYVATMKVIPVGDNDKSGCVIEWSFSTDPIEELTYEGMLNNFKSWVIIMANRMENDVLAPSA